MISWQNSLSVSVSWIDFHLKLTSVQWVGEGNASWGIWNAYHCIVGDLAVGEQQCIACLIWCLSTMPLVHYKACLSSSYQTPSISPFATQIIILTLNILSFFSYLGLFPYMCNNLIFEEQIVQSEPMHCPSLLADQRNQRLDIQRKSGAIWSQMGSWSPSYSIQNWETFLLPISSWWSRTGNSFSFWTFCPRPKARQVKHIKKNKWRRHVYNVGSVWYLSGVHCGRFLQSYV